MRVGIVFELLRPVPPATGLPADAFDEYEPEETIALLEAALATIDVESVRLGGPRELLAKAAEGGPDVDAALNIAEGYGTRNREAWAPVLLEMWGIPTLGSDALTLSASLDKVWTKRIVSGAGVRVAPDVSLSGALTAETALPAPFPLFVKPRWEGTAKGIDQRARVENLRELWAAVSEIQRIYRQPALVEPFLPGAEYTVTVVGHDPPRALPALQRALDRETGIGAHVFDRDAEPPRAHELPGSLDRGLEAALADDARKAFDALSCLDFARVDFRLDAAGQPHFLEINPLPTFAPDSSFGILAELEGRPAQELIGEVLAEGLQRLRLRP
ncbi:MAG: D-alanine--D-alanine ligase [Myxococcales bacterium]|nr:D-alanine--D-alanine ligase [Myxococcales bacterium]